MTRKILLLVIIFATLISLTSILSHAAFAAATNNDPLINEFVFDHTGIDVYEYVEVAGSDNTDYSAYTLLQLEADSSSSAQGTVDSAFTLTTTNGAGYWTTGFQTNLLENGSVSLLLVEAFSGTVGADLDTNDDGVLDVTPWLRIVDSVAVTDGDSGDFSYAAVTLPPGYDGLSGRVGGASRLPDRVNTGTMADWTRNDFDGAGLPGLPGTPEPDEALNTPKGTNLPALPSPASLVINEIDYDQPGADQGEFIEIRNNDLISVNLSPYHLDLVNGNGGVVYDTINLPDATLAPGDYFVVCTDAALVPNCDMAFSGAIQNGAPDAVSLWLDTTLIDTVSYEGDTPPPYTEGSGVGLEDDGVGLTGISRLPDGTDTGQNNADLSLRCLTPGLVNTSENDNCTLSFPPTIAITLTAVPLSLPEPGGSVDFTVQVANTGQTSVTLMTLTENSLGNLDGQGDCVLPQSLGIGVSYSCTYTDDVTGSPGQMVLRTVTAQAADNQATTATGSDSITITITSSGGMERIYLPLLIRDLAWGEPNNQCTEAYSLATNQAYQFLAEDENDWYRFTLHEAAGLRISLSNFVPQAGQLTVWYGTPCTGATRIGHDGSSDANRVLNLGVQPAGEYFIWLINAGALNDQDLYTIEVITP